MINRIADRSPPGDAGRQTGKGGNDGETSGALGMEDKSALNCEPQNSRQASDELDRIPI